MSDYYIVEVPVERILVAEGTQLKGKLTFLIARKLDDAAGADPVCLGPEI